MRTTEADPESPLYYIPKQLLSTADDPGRALSTGFPIGIPFHVIYRLGANHDNYGVLASIYNDP